MKSKFSKYIGLGALIALTACSSDDDAPATLQNGIAVSDVPISMSTGISNVEEGSFGNASSQNTAPASRNLPSGWNGQFTHNTGEGPNVLTDFICNAYANGGQFFDGQWITRDAGTNKCSWKGGTTWYWPQNDNLDFYAYAPTDYNFPITRDANGSAHVYGFEVKNPPCNDVIYAVKRNCNRWQDGGNVNLRFEHALSMIEIYIENYHYWCDVVFDGADFVNLQYKGNLELPSWDYANTMADDTKCWYSWRSDERKTFNTAALGAGNDGKATAITNNQSKWVPVLAETKALFLLPQTITRWNYWDGPGSSAPQLRLYGYVWDYRNNEYVFNSHGNAGGCLIFPLSEGESLNWEPGKRYTYTIKFGLAPDENGNWGNSDNMGWTSEGQQVTIPVSISVAISNWNWEHWHWWMY